MRRPQRSAHRTQSPHGETPVACSGQLTWLPLLALAIADAMLSAVAWGTDGLSQRLRELRPNCSCQHLHTLAVATAEAEAEADPYPDPALACHSAHEIVSYRVQAWHASRACLGR